MSTRWLTLIALTALGAFVGDTIGLPSAALFAGMLAGIGVALWWPNPRDEERGGAPPRVREGAEAIVGVVLGTYVQTSTLRAIGTDLLPILAVTLATLGLSVASGLVLARITELDRATAAFGTIAGGASGIIVMARGLGADERLVAVLQYLRVVVVVLLTPLLTALLFGHQKGGGGTIATTDAPALQGLAFAVVCAAAGLLLARRVPLPAPTLLLPLIVAAALTVAGAPGVAAVPNLLQQVAFGVIGVQVGLRFTPASLRRAGRVLLPTLAMVFALLAGSFLLALALAPVAHVSVLTAYLATTPGGLYAVLAVAVGSGADTTFVLAVQVLRLLVMLLAAPALAKRLAPRGG